jgi:flavin reductase (DIM6/NTAB) family NADH-FMN oxidoreductase RutF
MPIDTEEFRRALSSWPSGVTIVTSHAGDDVMGMTVSAFSSVSLSPPLVAVCADRTAVTHGLIERSGVFTVSVLAAGQEALSNRFASKREEHRRFEGLACPIGATGCRRIPGAVGWLDCRVVQTVAAGDHTIYIGRVEATELTDRLPLLYCRSTYGAWQPEG